MRVEAPWDRVSVARMMINNKFYTSAVAKDFVGRDGMQYLDGRCEPLGQFGIALLNSSNSLACSWNMSRIEPGLSQLSSLEASGWPKSRRSFPVLSV